MNWNITISIVGIVVGIGTGVIVGWIAIKVAVAKIESWQRHHEHVHELEEKADSHKFQFIDRRLIQLGNRYHDLAQDVRGVMERLGMKVRPRRKPEDEDDDK